ncbi:FtsX-like permease family protein [Candidatus Phytoplasma fraxini]|uniref:ABC3 transporter permease C-terminal domain-containing protein n=1 Tax=Ash yellows phytoplasma TaxID=35780 RepID=A0ABZ2U8G5_ASHYP
MQSPPIEFLETLMQKHLGTICILFCCILLISFFLIGGFVKSTIKFKKKDIGVLRSLGARKIDVLKIFFIEGFIISCLVTLILGVVFILPYFPVNWSYPFKTQTFEEKSQQMFVLQPMQSARILRNQEQYNDCKAYLKKGFENFRFWCNYFNLIFFFFIMNLIVTFLSIFLPINKFAKKKVIEVILDK